MIYENCYDYYFWEGVKAGEMIHADVTPDQVVPDFWIVNTTTIACQEAWMWGFCLGKSISKEEYQELKNEPEKPKEILETAEEISEFDYKYEQPKGNC